MYAFEKKAAAARARAAGKAAASQVALHLAEHISELRQIKNSEAITSIGPAGKGAARNEWRAEIAGPDGTPYEGGKFTIALRFEATYPMRAPKVWFIQSVFHPQVDAVSGAIALDVLGSRWLPSIRPWHIVSALHHMLRQPGEPFRGRSVAPVRCIPQSTGSYRAWLFERDRSRHDELARLWTQRFASPAASTRFVPSLFALAAGALGCEAACDHEGCTLAGVPESLWVAANDAREELGYSALGVRPPIRRPVGSSVSLQVPCRPFVPCRRCDLDDGHRCAWSADGYEYAGGSCLTSRHCVDCTGDGSARAEGAAATPLDGS